MLHCANSLFVMLAPIASACGRELMTPVCCPATGTAREHRAPAASGACSTIGSPRHACRKLKGQRLRSQTRSGTDSPALCRCSHQRTPRRGARQHLTQLWQWRRKAPCWQRQQQRQRAGQRNASKLLTRAAQAQFTQPQVRCQQATHSQQTIGNDPQQANRPSPVAACQTV